MFYVVELLLDEKIISKWLDGDYGDFCKIMDMVVKLLDVK